MTNFQKRILITAAILGGIFGGAPLSVGAATFVSGDIFTDTTWTKAESPYIINNSSSVKVLAGATLTIEPGVIVKLGNRSFLNVSGSLKAVGSLDDKIYFTSLKNDAIGGDDNADGNLTEPSPYDDWNIFLRSGSHDIEFKNAEFSYSNDVLYFYKSDAILRDVAISHIGYGIGGDQSDLILERVNISDTFSDALGGYNGSKISVSDSIIENVWDGDAIGLYDNAELLFEHSSILDIADGSAIGLYGAHATATDSVFSGGLYSGIELYDSWSTGPSTVYLENNLVENYLWSGLAVYSGSSAKVKKSVFHGNNYGLEVYDDNYPVLVPSFLSVEQSAVYDNGEYGIFSNTVFPIDARNNWWGDVSGPYHETENSDGFGNAVSDNVLFEPWLSSDPTVEKQIDPVIIIPGILGSAQKDGVWLIDPIFHTYDDLIATLAANGYVQDQVQEQNLFTFPYDWRFSNVLTAVALKDKIAEVKTICQCAKVDLVAHSMGGLVARQYIQSPQYAGDVDQLIFLGTPHLGAPKAYLPWEGAEMPVDVFDQGIRILLWWEAKKLDLSLIDYIHQSIFSIKELLPVYDYLTLKSNGEIEHYPSGYPTNTFLENLSAGTNQFLNSDIGIVNIVGDTGISTISSIIVASSTVSDLWEYGEPDELSYGTGDKTVPVSSASFIDKDVNVFSSDHNNLPFNARGLIYEKLTGKTAELKGDGPHLDAIMLIKILSPADIVVIAPNGERIGKDFATGQEVNEIPGAFYSGFGADDEYVTIPNPQNGKYRVETQGTGAGGAYTLATAFITNETSAERDFTGVTLPGMITPIEVTIDNTNPENLSVEPEDQMPPVITIFSPKVKDYIRGDIIAVNATTTDAGSGVLNFETTWDGAAILASTTVDSFYQKLGAHNFFVTSTDFVGNIATSSVDFRITATVRSLIKDFIRCYQLGWVSTKFDRTAFINKLDKFINSDKWPPKEKKNNDKLFKLALNVLLKLLDAQRGKHVDEQAYQILSEDIKWLLNN